jgi:hypothetical protein
LRDTLIAVSTASAPVFIGSTRSLPHSAASSRQKSAELVVHERPAGQRDPVELGVRGRDQPRVPVAEVSRRVAARKSR